MKFGLLEYTSRNIGDEIQSIAARQHLPRVDVYLKRDYLNEVKSKEDIKLIMNGWFTHKPQNWPPSPDIDPLFISFHISNNAKNSFTSSESINYFTKHEPIGCRDHHTRDLLLKHGVDAYFSGCLTMTLNNKYSDQNSGKIYLVDIDEDIYEELPQRLRDESVCLTHLVQTTASDLRNSMTNEIVHIFGDWVKFAKKVGIVSFYMQFWDEIEKIYYQITKKREMKFQKAQEYLDKYAQAKLVITSRLHVTLPCLAFNTPVILVHENPNDPRFSGLNKYINLYSKNEFVEMDGQDVFEGLENPHDIAELTVNMERKMENFLHSTN